jgi:hypothetical protein
MFPITTLTGVILGTLGTSGLNVDIGARYSLKIQVTWTEVQLMLDEIYMSDSSISPRPC